MRRFNKYTDNDIIGLMGSYDSMYNKQTVFVEKYTISESKDTYVNKVIVVIDRAGGGMGETVFESTSVKVFSSNGKNQFILTATNNRGQTINVNTDGENTHVEFFNDDSNKIDDFTTNITPVINNGTLMVIQKLEQL